MNGHNGIKSNDLQSVNSEILSATLLPYQGAQEQHKQQVLNQ